MHARMHVRTHIHANARALARTSTCASTREETIISLSGVVALCVEAGCGEQRFTPHRHSDVISRDTLPPSSPLRSIPQRAESGLPLGHPCQPQAGPLQPRYRAAPRCGTNGSQSTAGCRPPIPARNTRACTHVHKRARPHFLKHSLTLMAQTQVCAVHGSQFPTKANSSPRCRASVCLFVCAHAPSSPQIRLSLSLSLPRAARKAYGDT